MSVPVHLFSIPSSESYRFKPFHVFVPPPLLATSGLGNNPEATVAARDDRLALSEIAKCQVAKKISTLFMMILGCKCLVSIRCSARHRGQDK